jgi:hypothetical protein
MAFRPRVIYWVPQNSRNNSMGQCQLNKNLYHLFEDMGAQKVQL